MGREIGSRFGKCSQVCLTGSVAAPVSTGFDDQLANIYDELTLINQKLTNQTDSSSSMDTSSVFKTTAPTKVALYYFNQIEDQKLPAEQQVNIHSILPVYRIFPVSDDLLVDVVNELIKGNLTVSEQKMWFTTEFPHTAFKLLSTDLDSDGTLTLEFSEVPGFTDGGSARMLILQNVIQKTVAQFTAVKKIIFTPDTLFQP